ncbi:MAG TPA: phasin family protein [Rhodocyclaceae bacterium]|nr:phasin family protein [Rhodocyclaceae bacterium]
MANQEQFAEIQRRNLDAAVRLAQLSIENAQRIMALQTELAQSLLSDSMANAQAQARAKDGQEMFTLRAKYAQDASQRLMETASKMAEIGNEARVEFSRLLTEQLASGNKEMTSAFQGFITTLPGGNQQLMEMVQQAVNNANHAFESIVEATSATVQTATPKAATSRKKAG